MNRFLNTLLILALLVGTASLPSEAEAQKNKGKKQDPAPSTADLVWPPPPDQPRIQFVAMLSGAEDLTGSVKLSLVERMSGRSPVRDQTRLSKPYGVAIDKASRIFVADAAQRTVLIFDRKEKSVSRLKGNGQYPLFLPAGLTFDADGRLFVSDSFAGQVVVFEPGGRPIAALGKGTLERPAGMAIDSSRHLLFIADAKLNQVFVFSTQDLKLQRTIGSPSKPGQSDIGTFSGATNLALSSKGLLYVTDTFNCRVQVFNQDGSIVRAFGAQGTRPGSFVRPKGIGIDSEDHIYVADAAFNNFQIFTPEGKPLMFVGSAGDQPGQFLLPAGIAVDREDRIYVTEQRENGGRLQVFQYLRQPITQTSVKRTN